MANTYLLTREQLQLQGWARELALAHFQQDAERWEREGLFPWDHFATLAQHGILGLTLPRAYGGQERPRLDAILVQEQIARVCFTTAEAAHICLNGPSYAIGRIGSPALQEKYLPGVVAGNYLLGIAITEEQAGSSVGEVTTRATPTAGGVIIDGNKCFTTAGDIARAFQVIARFGGENLRGLGSVIVDAHTPGFSVVRVYQKMGGNGIHEASLRFEHCYVPAENILIPGDPQTEDGFKLSMRTYNTLRLGLAANALGVAQAALDLLVPHLLTRRQFGSSLANFQGLRWRVARLALALEQARLLTYRAAQLQDEYGFPPAYETAMAKLAATEVALEATDAAIQMFGWRGITTDCPAQRLYREIRGWTIAGGTSEILLDAIARTLFRHYEQELSPH
jgi:alkylation response protein AidB-like acyl-CoA dehydrogenase